MGRGSHALGYPIVWVDTWSYPTVQSYTLSRVFTVQDTAKAASQVLLACARVAELADARDLGSRG